MAESNEPSRFSTLKKALATIAFHNSPAPLSPRYYGQRLTFATLAKPPLLWADIITDPPHNQERTERRADVKF